MSPKLFLVLSSVVGLGCASGAPASPDGSIPQTGSGSFQSRLAAAAALWAKDKPACTTYHYSRDSTSFTGSSTETDIEITNDRPSRRRFVGRYVQDDGQVKTEQWDETGASIGLHEGYKASTVEELLADCRVALGEDPAANRLTLLIGVHGVPTACLFVPKNCADDCSMGVQISDFACGPLP
jgi:hypothetical protein